MIELAIDFCDLTLNTSRIILVVLTMSRTFFLFLFLLLWLWPLQGQKTPSRKLQKAIARIEAFDQAQVGVQLVQLENGKPLAKYQTDRYFTPASNAKLLTTLAAIQTFDSLPSLRYRKDSSGVLHFESTGYPLLEHPYYPDFKLKHFLQSADSLRYHPTKDDDLLNRLGPGWSWDDQAFYFSALPSVFPFSGNVVQFTKPKGQPILSTPSIFTLQDSLVLNTSFQRALHRNHFYVNPNRITSADTLYTPFIPSEKTTHALMENSLEKTIAIDAGPISEGTLLFTHQDAELYRAVLQDSDNLIAENLLLMVAKERLGLFSTKAIIEVLREEWAAAPDEWVWVDGSGLSRYNLVTPRNLIWLLQMLFQEMGPQKIQQYFPRAGVSGTLKRSYGGKQLPVVYAKTGTLRNNHNLSGYILDSQGKWYAFSILVNQHITSTTAVREGIQTLLEILTRRF